MKLLSFGFLLFLGFHGYSQVTNGLVAKYDFSNGSLKDLIGTCDAKIVGAGTTSDRFGKPNSAYQFFGTSKSYMKLGTCQSLKPQTGSISLWTLINSKVYSGSGYGYNPILLTKCCPGSSWFEAYCFYFDLNTEKFSTYTTESGTNNQPVAISKSPASFNKWYHLVVTFDYDSIRFYVNGSLDTAVYKGFSNTYLNSDSVMIGNSANAMNNRFFDGSVDDIRFYNRVISAKEVDTLYKDKPLTSFIASNQETQLHLFPNPSEDYISVQSNEKMISLTVYDIIGGESKQIYPLSENYKLDIRDLLPGVYFIKIKTDFRVLTEKILKK